MKLVTSVQEHAPLAIESIFNTSITRRHDIL